MTRRLALSLALALAGCAPAAPVTPAATGGVAIHVPTARVKVAAASGIDAAAAALPAVATGGPKLSLLADGPATRLPHPTGANGLFVALATPELGSASTDVSVSLDGAQANDPPAGATALDDATTPLGPSCTLPDDTAPPAGFRLLDLPAPIAPAGDDEKFWVIRPALKPPAGEVYNEVEVPAHRVAAGEHCQVYLDGAIAADPNVQAAARDLASAFDSSIFPTDTRVFGAAPDPGIDGDRRIFIVVSPQVSAGGTSSVLAYFARRDLGRQGDGVASHAHSNQKEVLFVDATTLLAPDRRADLLGAVAHEFQHLIHYYQKAVVGGVVGGEERWLDEDCAMYASAACGYGVMQSGLMYRHVAGYLQQAYQFSLTDWPGNPAGQGYGIGYLFISYLVERHGEGIVKELIGSRDRGKANLDARLRAHGSSYRQAFGDFAVAIATAGMLPDADNGRFALNSVPLRGHTPFGDLSGPTAIRIGADGARIPRHADTAYLLHLRPAPGSDPVVLRTSGGPFLGAAITP